MGQISKNFLPKKLSLRSQKYEFGIRDPRSGIRNKPIPDPGSRDQKGTGSRIRIRNTDGTQGGQCNWFSVFFTPPIPPIHHGLFGYSELPLYRGCGLACPYDRRGFVGAKKKTSVLILIPRWMCRWIQVNITNETIRQETLTYPNPAFSQKANEAAVLFKKKILKKGDMIYCSSTVFH